MNNIVFYFSGTGNSLKAAKTIAEELGNCEIVSMAKSGSYSLSKKYETIGFVYPVYFWGLPKKVVEFVKNIDLNGNISAYYYSIATYGGDSGNAVYQIYELLKKLHGVKLNYGEKLKMFSNYVVMYDMKKNVSEITKESNEKLVSIINYIKNRKNNKISKLFKVFGFVNKRFVKNVSGMDKNYSVNDNCTSCGICKEVCPVKNIEIINNKPEFKHNCEQCLACIQYCPQKAINYKNATQNRRRYTHPEINYKELVKYNNL